MCLDDQEFILNCAIVKFCGNKKKSSQAGVDPGKCAEGHGIMLELHLCKIKFVHGYTLISVFYNP